MNGYTSFSHVGSENRSYVVHYRGSGPPVVVIHELAGISPMLLAFADRVVAAGFTVYLPELIPRRRGPFRLLIASVQVCISAEFVTLARGRTSPIVGWLRSLAAHIHNTTGDRVGVVGMCLTGGFALAMAVEDFVAGPVMAHPSLPLAIGSRRRRDLGISRSDLTAVRARKDLRVFGVRFSSDLVAPSPRFDRMEAEFGLRFRRSEIPSGCRSRLGLPPWEHSVLNNRRLLSPADAESPAGEAIEHVVGEVMDFLKSELQLRRRSSR